MPKNWKSKTSQPLSTKGRRLEDIEREEEERKLEELTNRETLRRMVDLRSGTQNLRSTEFIFAHFSTHCRTHDDIVVPAEGAIVEMSLDGGIGQSWHSFLPPGDLPAGFYLYSVVRNNYAAHFNNFSLFFLPTCLIRNCTFISFDEKFLPARLFGTKNSLF